MKTGSVKRIVRYLGNRENGLDFDQVLVRLHWGVENGCHWTMDIVLGEDARPWCTQGQALRMLSWMRLLAYNALRFLCDRYLRSSTSRSMPWDELRRLVQRTLYDSLAWRTDSMLQATATL